MPRFNVKLPDGRWRVFSTIVEDFITEPMTFDELRSFRRDEYGHTPGTDLDTESLLTDKPHINRMGYSEAMWRARRLGVPDV